MKPERYEITLRGTAPIIQHNGAEGLDNTTKIAKEIKAITSKKSSTRTEADDDQLRKLETQRSLYLAMDANRKVFVTVPASALRSCIETAARKLKEGPKVREGLVVHSVDEFQYDKDRYGTSLDDLGTRTQFTCGVKVGQSRILRTRPRFDLPWGVVFTVEVDPELVDEDDLREWLDIGGRRIGLGDWRPEKSGIYGRFTADKIERVDERSRGGRAA